MGRRKALLTLFGAQVLFWCVYTLLVQSLRPDAGVQANRLPHAIATLNAAPHPAAAYVPGLQGPAILRIDGWRPALLEPARVALLTREGSAPESGRWSLTCEPGPCPPGLQAFAGPLVQVRHAATLERRQRFDVVWVAIAVACVLGAALLVLCPVNRSSRLQGVTGIFLMLVGADAWLTAFGAQTLPFAGFPILRYGVEYLMLAAAAISVNAFSGWRPKEAAGALAAFAAALVIVVGATAFHVRLEPVITALDGAALFALLGYGLVAMLRMSRTAPGPAIRVLALLLVGLASIAFDLFVQPHLAFSPLQASVIAPPVLMFGILLEIAFQGRRLIQASEEAYSDLERQLIEQDASLLASSQLLRHQERQLAIDAERQRLLRDMHDGVGGVLTHLLLDARSRRLADSDLEQGLQSAVDDMRNMASAMDAGNEPIDEALAMFGERMTGRLARSGITFDYRCTLPIPAPSLDVRRLLSLYRLLQEGVANTLRHAQAKRIDLTAAPAPPDAIRVTLADDGQGFSPALAAGAPGEGRGLTNIRRRTQQLGGRLEIVSAPGEGTRLILIIPVAAPRGARLAQRRWEGRG
jgi:signal transduction histidine kinase